MSESCLPKGFLKPWQPFKCQDWSLGSTADLFSVLNVYCPNETEYKGVLERLCEDVTKDPYSAKPISSKNGARFVPCSVARTACGELDLETCTHTQRVPNLLKDNQLLNETIAKNFWQLPCRQQTPPPGWAPRPPTGPSPRPPTGPSPRSPTGPAQAPSKVPDEPFPVILVAFLIVMAIALSVLLSFL